MAQLWRAQVSGGAAIWGPLNGPGTPTTPTIGTIVSGDTTLTIPYSGPVTHYRVYEIGASAPAWIAVPASPIVFTGVSNREYNVEVSGNGSSVADAKQAGTNNPGTGGGTIPSTVENNLALAYSVLGSASADRTLAYTVIGAVSADRTLAYSVLGSAQQDRTLAYSVLGAASADRTLTYTVFNAVSADRTLAYSVLGSASADRTLTYSVLGAVQQDLSLVYEIEESGTVFADLTIEYGIGGAVTRDLTLNYGVFGAVQSDLSLAYSVLRSAQQDLAFAYQVVASVVADRTLTYAVIGSVERDLYMEWSIFSGSGGGAGAAEIWEGITLEGDLTPGDMLRVILAAVSGRTTGIGTATEYYLSKDGTKARIAATFDSAGNRESVTLDATP